MSNSKNSTDPTYKIATPGQLSVAFIVRVAALGLVTVMIAASVFIFPLDAVVGSKTQMLGAFLFDRYNLKLLPYPFTIQNLMWVVFSLGCAELAIRHITASQELQQLDLRLLPEDAETMLRQGADIVPHLTAVQRSDPAGLFWMQRLLRRLLLSFQGTGSIDRTQTMLNTSLDLYQNEIDLRYNSLRYIVWLIPTLGFIGTVTGILQALISAGAAFGGITATTDISSMAPAMMKDMTNDLGVAFYTTLLALLLSAGLMFAMHYVQGREESALNRVGQYCLDNLINRLFQPNR